MNKMRNIGQRLMYGVSSLVLAGYTFIAPMMAHADKKESRWYGTVSTGVDVPIVLHTTENPLLDIGLGIGYDLNNKWSIENRLNKSTWKNKDTVQDGIDRVKNETSDIVVTYHLGARYKFLDTARFIPYIPFGLTISSISHSDNRYINNILDSATSSKYNTLTIGGDVGFGLKIPFNKNNPKSSSINLELLINSGINMYMKNTPDSSNNNEPFNSLSLFNLFESDARFLVALEKRF